MDASYSRYKSSRDSQCDYQQNRRSTEGHVRLERRPFTVSDDENNRSPPSQSSDGQETSNCRKDDSPDSQYRVTRNSRATTFQCRVCKEIFVAQAFLYKHLKAKGHQVATRFRSSTCLLCQKSFSARSDLQKHLRESGHAVSRKYVSERHSSGTRDSVVSPSIRRRRRSSHDSSSCSNPRKRSPSYSSPENSPVRSTCSSRHIRKVVFVSESPPPVEPKGRMLESLSPREIALHVEEGNVLKDPRTVSRRKSRFMPKRIPTAQSKIPEYYSNFPRNCSLPWKLLPCRDNLTTVKRNSTEVKERNSCIEPDAESFLDNVDAKVQKLVASLSSELNLDQVSGYDELSSEGDIGKMDTPCAEKAEAFENNRQLDAVGNDEALQQTDHNLNLTAPCTLGEGTQGNDPEKLPSETVPGGIEQSHPVNDEIFSTIEERLTLMFDEPAQSSTQEHEVTLTSCGTVTAYMYIYDEPIDNCPECDYDLNLSPLVTVDVVTRDVRIDCTDCGTRVVMQHAYNPI